MLKNPLKCFQKKKKNPLKQPKFKFKIKTKFTDPL